MKPRLTTGLCGTVIRGGFAVKVTGKFEVGKNETRVSGKRSKNSMHNYLFGARLLTVAIETIEQKLK